MNRHCFLQLLSAGTIGAATFDLERLLWVPGQKTIFLPSTAPTLLDITSPIAWIAKDAMDLFAAAVTRPLGYDKPLSPRLLPALLGPPWRISDLNDIPTLLPTWKEVRTAVDDSVGVGGDHLRRNIIEPSMYALADAFRHKQHRTFGQLTTDSTSAHNGIDSAVATDPIKGVSVRARRWYDLYSDRMYLAFDVMGGP